MNVEIDSANKLQKHAKGCSSQKILIILYYTPASNQNSQKHEAASQSKKTRIAWPVVEAVEQRQGEFLTWHSQG